MSHLCESCDHLASEHPDAGRCVGDCFDPDYGFYKCVCPRFERDPDD